MEPTHDAGRSARLSCPHLPPPGEILNHAHLGALREENGPELYLTALRYAQQLWLNRLPARSILALDRSFFAKVPAGHEVLKTHPMPYAALAWICRHHGDEGFLGNPRVSFQHVADRARGPDARLKNIRAWACWAVVCAARPDLPGDPRHAVEPPSAGTVAAGLREVGGEDEVRVWAAALGGSGPAKEFR